MALLKRNNLSPRPLIKGACCAGALLILSGCADYLNNWDSSSARSGNAHQANTAIQSLP